MGQLCCSYLSCLKLNQYREIDSYWNQSSEHPVKRICNQFHLSKSNLNNIFKRYIHSFKEGVYKPNQYSENNTIHNNFIARQFKIFCLILDLNISTELISFIIYFTETCLYKLKNENFKTEDQDQNQVNNNNNNNNNINDHSNLNSPDTISSILKSSSGVYFADFLYVLCSFCCLSTQEMLVILFEYWNPNETNEITKNHLFEFKMSLKQEQIPVNWNKEQQKNVDQTIEKLRKRQLQQQEKEKEKILIGKRRNSVTQLNHTFIPSQNTLFQGLETIVNLNNSSSSSALISNQKIDLELFFQIHQSIPLLLWPLFKLQFQIQEATLGLNIWIKLKKQIDLLENVSKMNADILTKNRPYCSFCCCLPYNHFSINHTTKDFSPHFQSLKISKKQKFGSYLHSSMNNNNNNNKTSPTVLLYHSSSQTTSSPSSENKVRQIKIQSSNSS